nr:aspyridones efflux protein apdf [Quercus suber]
MSAMEVELESRRRLPHSRIGANDSTVIAESPPDAMQTSQDIDASAPDGGYGWIALAASGVLCFWFVGTTYCWGVLQDALLANKLSSPSTLSFVGSLTIAFIAFLAIINAQLLARLGSQKIAFSGISFLGGREILSGFATQNIGGLFITAGVVMGIGVSLCFMVVSSVPSQYFNHKRGLANGIVFASGGLGGAVISFLMNGLLQSLGVAWTFRIVGLLTLATGLPAAWFVRDRVKPLRRSLIDRSLFTDSRFILLFLAGAVATFPLLVPPFFLPLYCNSINLSSSAAAGLVAAFNFASALGRIGAGFLSDRIGPLNTLFGFLVLSAVSMLVLWPLSTTLGPLIAFAIINGAANGGFFALMPTVAGRTFGSARVSTAMGMLVTGWSGGYLMAGFKAYRPAIYYAGSVTIAAAVLVAVLFCAQATFDFGRLCFLLLVPSHCLLIKPNLCSVTLHTSRSSVAGSTSSRLISGRLILQSGAYRYPTYRVDKRVDHWFAIL